MQDADTPKMYKVELLVESFGPPDLVRTDIVNALAPKGFFPQGSFYREDLMPTLAEVTKNFVERYNRIFEGVRPALAIEDVQASQVDDGYGNRVTDVHIALLPEYHFRVFRESGKTVVQSYQLFGEVSYDEE